MEKGNCQMLASICTREGQRVGEYRIFKRTKRGLRGVGGQEIIFLEKGDCQVFASI